MSFVDGGSIFDSDAYGGYDGGAFPIERIAAAVQVVAVLALLLTAVVAIAVSAGINPGTNVMSLYTGLSAWLTIALVALFAADRIRTGKFSILVDPWSQARTGVKPYG